MCQSSRTGVCSISVESDNKYLNFPRLEAHTDYLTQLLQPKKESQTICKQMTVTLFL